MRSVQWVICHVICDLRQSTPAIWDLRPAVCNPVTTIHNPQLSPMSNQHKQIAIPKQHNAYMLFYDRRHVQNALYKNEPEFQVRPRKKTKIQLGSDVAKEVTTSAKFAMVRRGLPSQAICAALPDPYRILVEKQNSAFARQRMLFDENYFQF